MSETPTTIRKAIVVDDHAATRYLAACLLQRRGYEVHTAEDGLFALELFSVQKPNIVFTDLKMPRMTGLELAAELHKGPYKTRIVLASADHDLLRESRHSVDAILRKPYTQAELYQCLE